MLVKYITADATIKAAQIPSEFTFTDYEKFRTFINSCGIEWFDLVYLPNHTILVVDDEGLLKDMCPTVQDRFNGQMLVGPVILARSSGEDLYPPSLAQYETFNYYCSVLGHRSRFNFSPDELSDLPSMVR